MKILRMIWFRLRALVQRDAVNAEFDEELRFHIERETAENIKRGMSPDDARRAALAEFGGVERFKEYVRDERQVRWLDDLSGDIRHGVRLLRKDRLFSAAVIGTLALGIGATSTIFAIVNGVLLRPLPYPSADRIVALSEKRTATSNWGAGQYAFNVWQQATQSFSSVAVFSQSAAVLTGQGEPIEIFGGAGTQSFFNVFQANVLMGRGFTSEDYAEGAPRIVVLSTELWRSTFGSDSSILGKQIEMNGRPRTVVGVVAPGFEFPQRARYWTPLIIPNTPGAEYYFAVVARLRNGASLESARKDLERVQPQVDTLRTKVNRDTRTTIVPLHEELFGSARKPLTMLAGAVVVLLLIACANVANLTLARSASRQREFAVRLALGAGRWRLIRQLLVESSVLAALGGAIGALMPFLLVGAFVKLSPTSVAGVSDIRVDGTVIAFTAITSLLAALVFGLAPALTGAKSNASGALASGSSRSGQSKSHRTIRASLVVFEVSAALTLVTGAVLLTKSFSRAISVSPGFETRNLYATSITLPSVRYPKDSHQANFYTQLAERLAATQGIDAVSLSRSRPMGGFSYSRKLAATPDAEPNTDIAFAEVDGNYATTVGMKLISGRFLATTDVKGTPDVAMISRSAANFFFPGTSPIGKTLPRLRTDTGPTQTVVGVVEDVPQHSLDVKPTPQVFQTVAQHTQVPQTVTMRSSLSASAVRAQVKRIVAEIDPRLPVSNFYVMEEEVAKTVAPRRFNSILINAFAGLALALAMIGLYGLMAHAVAMRTRELGIRIALGAQAENVLRLVMKQGTRLVIVGIVIGAMLSLALSRTVASLLYETPAQDLVAFLGAPVLLLLVGLVACYIPARRATRVDPIAALRQE